MDKVQFGKLIQLLRKEKQLSQKDLANDLHITPSSVCKWEQGKSLPDVYMIANLATYFEISCDDLYHPEDTIQRIISTESILGDIPKHKKMINHLTLSIIVVLLMVSALLIYLNTKSPFTQLSSQYINHETLGYVYQIEYSISSEQDEYCMMKHAKQSVDKQLAILDESDNVEAILIIYYFDYINENNRSVPDYLYCHMME